MSARDLLPDLQTTLGSAALKRMGRTRKRVVFLVHAPELFSAIEPIIREMQRRPEQFDLVIFALPRNYSGKANQPFSGLERTYLFLDAKGLKPIALSGRSARDIETLVRLAPDFLFRQSPWAPDIPDTFDARQLGFTHLCYVPYGLDAVDLPAVGTYCQPFHNACDFIFCANDLEYASFANHREMGALGVQVTGYPRYEQLLADLEAADPNAWPLATPANAPRVIWAPHHSLDAEWLGYSTFLQHKDAMLAEARRGRISLLLRPHPAMRDRIVARGLMSAGDYDAYLEAFANAGCSGVDRESEYARSFAASDCMITDGLGFFGEYMLTSKPLIRTRRPDSTPLSALYQWLVQACDNVDDTEALDRILDALALHRYVDPQAALRVERRQLLVAMGEGASRRIVDKLQAW